MSEDREKPQLDSLDQALATLPRQVQPDRDLWPGIAASLPARRDRIRPWLPLAAAVSAVAFAGLLAVQLLLPESQDPGTPVVAAVPGQHLAGPSQTFFAAEAAYRQVRAQRVADLEQQLSQLSPETRERVTSSLETIQSALVELRTALDEAPADPVLQHLLLSVYSQEMAVLGQIDEATRLVADGSLEI